MSKRKRPPNTPRTPSTPPPQRGRDVVGLSTLIVVAVVLVVSVLNLQAAKRIQSEFEGKLRRLEDRIAKVSDKISSPAAQPAAAPPPRRGPDPNRVYQIKTAGAPIKGPASAPVTIAEFSDFQ